MKSEVEFDRKTYKQEWSRIWWKTDNPDPDKKITARESDKNNGSRVFDDEK